MPETVQIDLLLDFVAQYGFWGFVIVIFAIFGLPQIAPIIAACGTWHNERHKANLSHQRSLEKLRNKTSQDAAGKEKKNG